MTSDPKEQFSLIYDQYIDKIYRFVYLKVNSEEMAQDITSAVFLHGFKAYQKGQDIKNPGAFLYKIASNMVTDYYRKKGKEKTVSIEHVGQIADKESTIYEKAIVNADILEIKSAILSLKKDYQDILIWYYLEDMSADEIAQLIHKPAGTVRVMIHRGLESLKQIFKDKA